MYQSFRLLKYKVVGKHTQECATNCMGLITLDNKCLLSVENKEEINCLFTKSGMLTKLTVKIVVDSYLIIP
jgi:hypothetical protein